MTKEHKIEILKDLLIQLSDSANILCTCEADERCEVVEECIKALEQPTMDKAMIHILAKENDELKAEIGRLRQALEQQPCEDYLSREFIKIIVEYPPEDLCTYPEYKGKPYFSIVYRENGEEFVGYGTYKPEVLTDYLKRYFMPTISYDCVSRERIKQIVSNITAEYDTETIHVDRLMDEIDNMPPVTPTQRWIPVSERLPKDRNWYLGIFKEHDTGWINPLPFVCDYVGEETKATTKDYWILRCFTDIYNPCDYYKNLECVAWQPLPQPYEEK